MESFPRRCTRVEWAEAPAANPTGTVVARPIANVVNAAMSCVEKKALVVGGVNPRTGKSIAQTLEYDLTTKLWTHHGAWFPVPLSEATMCPLSQPQLGHVLFGGWDDVDVLADVWVLEQQPDEVAGGAVLQKHAWRKAATHGASPCARRGHSMTHVPPVGDQAGYYLVFGGFDGAQRLNDLWRLDVLGSAASGWESKWTPLLAEGDVPAARDGAAVGFDPATQRLIVFGGFTVGVDNGTFVYDISQQRWQRLSTLAPPSKRQLCIGVVHHSAFVVLFGHDGRAALQQVCQLQTADASNKWSMVHVDGDELDARTYFSWCVAEGGKKILVFGGLAAAPRPKTAGGTAVVAASSPAGITYVSSLLDIELERCETAPPAKGGKK